MQNKIIYMNKKQTIDAIKKYPYLNTKQRDILMYFVLISSDATELPHTIYITISHVADATKVNVNQAYRAIEGLKKKNLITEVIKYKNKIYHLNDEEIEKLIKYTKRERIAKELQKN